MKKNDVIQYQEIAERLNVDIEHVWTFRRKAMTLRNWFEKECGDSNNYASWAIERDEVTDKPYLVTYPHTGKMRRSPVPDREKGARKAIDKLCKKLELFYYIQTDCRGLSLYLSRKTFDGYQL